MDKLYFAVPRHHRELFDVVVEVYPSRAERDAALGRASPTLEFLPCPAPAADVEIAIGPRLGTPGFAALEPFVLPWLEQGRDRYRSIVVARTRYYLFETLGWSRLYDLTETPDDLRGTMRWLERYWHLGFVGTDNTPAFLTLAEASRAAGGQGRSTRDLRH